MAGLLFLKGYMTIERIPINLTCVSPSGVGDVAACLQKLVFDTDYPEDPDDPNPYQAHADFGTVCHYESQTSLGGISVPPKKYTQEQWDSARSCPGVPKTHRGFVERIRKCAEKANETVNRVTPLPADCKWTPELRAYNPKLLPTRIGRKGDVCGYGGMVDLIMSNRSVLWDYKFTGQIPTARAESEVKTTYLWQCLSYHINTGVPKTGIVWTNRMGTASCYVMIDWAIPQLQNYISYLGNFFRLIQKPNFRDLAYPIRGDQCFFCRHRRAGRCPAWHIPDLVDTTVQSLFSSEPNALDDLLNAARSGEGVSTDVKPATVPAAGASTNAEAHEPTKPPPPPPPVNSPPPPPPPDVPAPGFNVPPKGLL